MTAFFKELFESLLLKLFLKDTFINPNQVENLTRDHHRTMNLGFLQSWCLMAFPQIRNRKAS